MNEKYEFPCGGDMCENQPCCEAGLGVHRIRIKPPQGELLPAEERLQNVLKAIVDRILEEQAILRSMEDHVDLDSQTGEDAYIAKRNFISGLDIAWSLAQTESLRTSG